MKHCIVIQTDFGRGGGSAMHGVCKMIDPALEVYEINHTIEKFNIKQAARSLNLVAPYWPEGTVFVSVIDPGVGTSRRASVAKLKNGSYVVTPDNGALTDLMKSIGVEEIRVIDESRNRLKGTEKVSIFHGRDLFAYCGAKLASGIIDFEGVGEAYDLSEIVTFETLPYSVEDGIVKGYITDRMGTFGNLESNIPISAMEKAGFQRNEKIRTVIKENEHVVFDEAVPYQVSFGHVGIGEFLIYNSSDGVMGMGMNQRDFIHTYAIGMGKEWTIEFRKEKAHA